MTTSAYLILGAVLVGIFICCCCAEKSDQDLEKRKKEERKAAWFELYYDDRHKEYEFWRYFGKREKGKLLYIVPEFEQRIVKMNKLKKGRD